MNGDAATAEQRSLRNFLRLLSRRQRILATLIGSLVAVAGVLIAWQQYQRAKRLFAITEIVAKWNDNTAHLKDEIELHYPGLYNRSEFSQFGPDEAQALFEADEEQDAGLYAVRQSVVELLNYFEYIAITCENDVADEEIVRQFAGGPMKRWGTALEDFIRIYNTARGTSVWAPYYRVVERWDPALVLTHDGRPSDPGIPQ